MGLKVKDFISDMLTNINSEKVCVPSKATDLVLMWPNAVRCYSNQIHNFMEYSAKCYKKECCTFGVNGTSWSRVAPVWFMFTTVLGACLN